MSLPRPEEVANAVKFCGNKHTIAAEVLADRRRFREACARICVRRSCTWSESDDERSQDFREGIEVAASQLACAIRAMDIGDKSPPVGRPGSPAGNS